MHSVFTEKTEDLQCRRIEEDQTNEEQGQTRDNKRKNYEAKSKHTNAEWCTMFRRLERHYHNGYTPN